jgi:hypothetical protein
MFFYNSQRKCFIAHHNKVGQARQCCILFEIPSTNHRREKVRAPNIQKIQIPRAAIVAQLIIRRNDIFLVEYTGNPFCQAVYMQGMKVSYCVCTCASIHHVLTKEILFQRANYIVPLYHQTLAHEIAIACPEVVLNIVRDLQSHQNASTDLTVPV